RGGALEESQTLRDGGLLVGSSGRQVRHAASEAVGAAVAKSIEIAAVPKRSGMRAQLEILKIPALWIVCLASGAMYVTRYAINSWGMLYLQEAKGYSMLEAGGILGLNTVAGLVGCIAYGFVSDTLFKARRPPVTLIYGVIVVFSLIVIFFAPSGHLVVRTAAFTVSV